MSALHSWGFIRLEEGASELGDRGADPFPSHCISLHVCVLSHFSWVQLFATPWTVAHQALLSMWILQARILESVAIPCSRGSSQPKDRIHISCLMHWQSGYLPLVPTGKPTLCLLHSIWDKGLLLSASVSPSVKWEEQ